MNKHRSISIRGKLIALITGVSAGVLVFTGLLFYWAEERAQESNILTELNIFAEIFADTTASALISDDQQKGTEILSSLRANPALRRATVYRNNNSIFADYLNHANGVHPDRHEALTFNDETSEKVLSVIKPISVNGARVGTIAIQSGFSRVHDRMDAFARILALILTGSTIVAFALASKFQAVISRPLTYLARIIEQVSKTKNYSIRAEVQSLDETGDLMVGFNQMLGEIEQRDKKLRATHDELELHVADRTQKLLLEIAERERVEQALRREEEQMRLLIRHAPVAMAMLDMEMRYVEFSDRWLSKFASERPDLHGVLHEELFPTTSDKFKELLASAMNGTLTRLDEEVFEVDPSDRHVNNWTAQPWYRPDGRQGGIILVSVNVSGLVEARENALHVAKLKSQFLANLSHEVRTPLNAIIGFADIVIQSPDLEPSVRNSVETIESSARLLLLLINDVLDFSKLDSKKMDLEHIDVSVRKVVSQVVEMLSPEAARKGIGLHVDIDPLLPEFIKGDATRLMQVLINLVGNAIKFTELGEVRVIARTEGLTGKHPKVSIEVWDTGIGIPEEAQYKIFDAFTQADGSTTRRFGGTGLGLAISSKLVELMGGKISIESQPRQGSRFSFKIDCVSVSRKDRESKREELISSQANTEIIPENRKILVVEDNLVNQKLISLILRKNGYQVEIAENGADAVAMTSEQEFALVFMDLQMPVMDGLQATRAIRAKESPGKRLPIVALTAHAFPEDRELSLSAGVDEYLTKPINRNKLLETIKRFVA